jgi:translation elongation factor EF-Ts
MHIAAGITVKPFVRFRIGEGIEKNRPAFGD